MVRQRWRRKRWISVVQEFEDSGMTQREFARHHQLKLPTFQSQIYKLWREGGAEPPLRFVKLTGAEASSTCVTVVVPGGLEVVLRCAPRVPPRCMNSVPVA